MFSETAGRVITEAEIKRNCDTAAKLEKQFSIAGLTDKREIKAVVKKAQAAWSKAVGREGFVNVDSKGLVFEFDNMRLNRSRL